MIHTAAEIPVISPVFQTILDTIGWVLARIYDVIPNYGVAIILLTIVVRVILLPLGVKQIRSMSNMQRLQPKIKALQQKYKGNRTKQQEEIMKLYRESGVNPLSGCWPVLLQFPILIAMYAVLRPPIFQATQTSVAVGAQQGASVLQVESTGSLNDGGLVQIDGREIPFSEVDPSTSSIHLAEPLSMAVSSGQAVNVESATNNHLPTDSTLFENVIQHQNTDLVYMNLQCSAIQAGTGAVSVRDAKGDPAGDTIDCGTGIPVRVPYYLFLAAMVGTTFYQQRQMQRAAPPGSTNPQQQALFKVMPLMFGIFGIGFPVGLVVYWVTSNTWQIGQQYAMLRLGHIGPNAKEPRPNARSTRPGFLSRLMEQAQSDRARRDDGGGQRKSGAKGSPRRSDGSASRSGSGSGRSGRGASRGTRSGSGSGSRKNPKRPPSGSTGGASGSKPTDDDDDGGTGSAGSGKKRPKR